MISKLDTFWAQWYCMCEWFIFPSGSQHDIEWTPEREQITITVNTSYLIVSITQIHANDFRVTISLIYIAKLFRLVFIISISLHVPLKALYIYFKVTNPLLKLKIGQNNIFSLKSTLLTWDDFGERWKNNFVKMAVTATRLTKITAVTSLLPQNEWKYVYFLLQSHVNCYCFQLSKCQSWLTMKMWAKLYMLNTSMNFSKF